MKRLFNTVFPVLDHLYIFQNLEYEVPRFLKWFLKHPYNRNLQRKHQLELTAKAGILLVISLVLIVLTAVLASLYLKNGSIGLVILGLIFVNIGPVFLMASQIFLRPIEEYQKRKIVRAAKARISQLKDLKIVAITGSFAKTSTKDMLYTLLWKDFRVVRTPKSYNTYVSIARTILEDLKTNTEVFLVEMDAYHRGEIDQLSKLARPDLAVITAIAAQHLERFGSMEMLAKTQFEIAENLAEEGLLYLNSSDEWSRKLEGDYGVNKGFFGLNPADNYHASEIKQTTRGMAFRLYGPTGQVEVELPLFGKHHVVNFLAAAAVANQLGLSLKTIQKRAALVLPTPHRLELIRRGNLTIIDNTYNTNPTAYKSSFDLLNNYPGAKKILITPGLVELGATFGEENQQFAKDAAGVADEIIIVGQNARAELNKGLHQADFSKDRSHYVDSTSEAMNLLPKVTIPDSVVLLENDLPDQYF